MLDTFIDYLVRGKGVILFDNENQMNRAMSILSQYKLMDRQLKVMDGDACYVMYLYNVNVNESLENVAQRCEEVVGEQGAVMCIKQFVNAKGNS